MRLFLFLFLLNHALGYGQSDIIQSVRGTVIDYQSGHPVIGASVQLQSVQEVGDITDIDGNFKIDNVPVGRHVFVISHVGYLTTEQPNVVVYSGKETVLNIVIKEKVNQLDELVVRANKNTPVNTMSSGSARSLSIEELSRFSGSFMDPARMAQNYAGVSGANDDRNDIIVRGNSPTGVLWRVEGVDIPAPNHWSILGTTGGPVSMLNANNLSNSDFISGAFAAEYSNATAAVFDLKLRNGNPEQYEFLGQIGFNGFELGAEGPISIGKNASFIANVRYSTLEVFNQLGINLGTGSATPNYKDATFKLNIPTDKLGILSLWGIGGISDISLYDDQNNIYSQGNGKINSGSQTGILGLSHLYFFNQKTSSRINLSVSQSNSVNTSSELDAVDNVFISNYNSDTRQTKYGLNWVINHKWSTKSRLKTGIRLDMYDMDIKDSVLLENGSWFNETSFIGNTSLLAAFAQWQYYFNDKLILNVGINNSLFFLNNGYAIEPRFGLKYQLNTKNIFSLGYGRHSQIQPLPIYFSRDNDTNDNEQLDLIYSDHFVLSYEHHLNSSMRLKLEAYYQYLSNLAVESTSSSFSMINTGADFGFPNQTGLVNMGTGSNKGVEITIEKALTKGYYFLLTGSLFDSQYKGSDGIQRNTFFNSNYVTNFLAGKEFKFNDRWSLLMDTRISFAGGRRYTPIDLNRSIAEGREVKNYTETYEAQYKPYFRADFKISVRNNQPKYTQLWSIDLTNLTGRNNEFSKSYNPNTQNIVTTYQRGFFPNILYQILF